MIRLDHFRQHRSRAQHADRLAAADPPARRRSPRGLSALPVASASSSARVRAWSTLACSCASCVSIAFLLMARLLPFKIVSDRKFVRLAFRRFVSQPGNHAKIEESLVGVGLPLRLAVVRGHGCRARFLRHQIAVEFHAQALVLGLRGFQLQAARPPPPARLADCSSREEWRRLSLASRAACECAPRSLPSQQESGAPLPALAPAIPARALAAAWTRASPCRSTPSLAQPRARRASTVKLRTSPQRSLRLRSLPAQSGGAFSDVGILVGLCPSQCIHRSTLWQPVRHTGRESKSLKHHKIGLRSASIKRPKCPLPDPPVHYRTTLDNLNRVLPRRSPPQIVSAA